MSSYITLMELYKGQNCKQDFKYDFGDTATKDDFKLDFGFDTSVIIPDPAVSFSTSGTSGVAPFSVNFAGSATNSPTSWSWTFGDGGTSTEQTLTYVFENAGTFEVTLTVGNESGSGYTTETVTVSPTVIPTSAFSGTPTSGAHPLTVQFTDQSLNAPTSWSWTFGDGGTSTAQNPSYTYAAAGTYTVSLVATNQAGSNTGTRSAYITVT